MKYFSTEYNCIIEKTENDFEINAFSLLDRHYSKEQTKDDIREAINVAKVFDIDTLKIGEKAEIKFGVRFVENQNKTYNQIFYKI